MACSVTSNRSQNLLLSHLGQTPQFRPLHSLRLLHPLRSVFVTEIRPSQLNKFFAKLCSRASVTICDNVPVICFEYRTFLLTLLEQSSRPGPPQEACNENVLDTCHLQGSSILFSIVATTEVIITPSSIIFRLASSSSFN